MFDSAGFNQELKELAEKYDMLQSMRFVHRYHCATRSNFHSPCSCVGRQEYVLYSREAERAEDASQALKQLGGKL